MQRKVTLQIRSIQKSMKLYSTCFGKIWLSVLPHLVEYDLTVNGGRISLEYDLFVDDKLVSYNGLVLNIKEDFPQ